MNISHVDLGLLADLDASVECGRTLGGQHAPWPAVEDAKAKSGVACRLARAVEAVVVFSVPASKFGATLEQHRAQLGVIANAGDAKLELRLDGAVSRSAQTPARHAASRTGAAPAGAAQRRLGGLAAVCVVALSAPRAGIHDASEPLPGSP